jgi:CrcB protein
VLVTGLLGGFTTFSTFTYETAGLMEERELPWAALNFALSVLGGFAFAVLGAAIA